jgi:hypothetical protein
MRRQKSTAIAQAWKNPQFSTLEGMEYAVMNLEDAEFESVQVRGQTVPRYALVGKNTGQFFGTCTDKYKIVQCRDAFSGLVDAIRETGLPVHGSVIKPTVGEIRLVVVVDRVISGLDGEYKLVIEAVNSYNGCVSWGAMSSILRVICANGMMKLQGITAEMHHRHVLQDEVVAEHWEHFYNNVTAQADNVNGVIARAMNQPVRNLEAVYLGAGFGQNVAKWVIKDFESLVPESKTHTLTLLDAYHGLTNYFSNRTKGNYQTNRELLERASQMLEIPCETLEMKGLPLIKVAATP